MEKSELFYQLALLKTKGVGSILFKKLIEKFGSAEAVFQGKKNDFFAIERLPKIVIEELLSKKSFAPAQIEIEFIEKENIHPHAYTDPDYPENLKQCYDAPPLLFCSEPLHFNNQKIIAIVGTRKISHYGMDFCKQLIEDLKPLNPIIISGFAYGTDIHAHLTAIENQIKTYGVLAHGLDHMYPASHKKYSDLMKSNGGFITEYPSKTNADRDNFVKRNRIVAGLAHATIVIESTKNGGSLITANFANEYARDVFALPGRINDPLSLGCNHLIKTQQAHLIESVADLIYIMNWNTSTKKQSNPPIDLFAQVAPNLQPIISALQQERQIEIDTLAHRLNVTIAELNSKLFELEMQGLILQLPGKKIQLA